jgi:retron-type reverse transcriptase
MKLTTQTYTVDIAQRCGDGVVVLRNIGRTTAVISTVRTISSKAGDNTARRGSELMTSQSCSIPNINIKSISNIKNLVLGYESIKSNPGNMTPGLDPSTLDGIDMAYLKRIQEKLKAGVYKFNPARRIQIPKPGKESTRPLTIASPREKLVQKAIQQVLEPFFEPKFSESSHGFRPERGGVPP